MSIIDSLNLAKGVLVVVYLIMHLMSTQAVYGSRITHEDRVLKTRHQSRNNLYTWIARASVVLVACIYVYVRRTDTAFSFHTYPAYLFFWFIFFLLVSEGWKYSWLFESDGFNSFKKMMTESIFNIVSHAFAICFMVATFAKT